MESIQVVEDWDGFCEYLLRCHNDADLSDLGAVWWSYPLSVSIFAYFEVFGRAECDIIGAGEGVLVHFESQFGRQVQESEWLCWKSAK